MVRAQIILQDVPFSRVAYGELFCDLALLGFLTTLCFLVASISLQAKHGHRAASERVGTPAGGAVGGSTPRAPPLAAAKRHSPC